MDVSKVSLEDGRACAQLIKFLNVGRWELSGSDAEVLSSTKRWVQELAMRMAEQLKAKTEAPPTAVAPQGFRVKSIGSLPGSSPKSAPKAKKSK